MSILYIDYNKGNDSTAMPNRPDLPWKTTAAISRVAAFGDTIRLPDDGEVVIPKDDYQWFIPDGVSVIGSGNKSLVNSFCVDGINPGSDCFFGKFAFMCRDMNNNHQWGFKVPLGRRSERCQWQGIYYRGDSDMFQTGSGQPCSGTISDCDLESKADGLIFAGRGAECNYRVERSRIAVIGPSVHMPDFKAQALNVGRNVTVSMRDSKLITTYAGVLYYNTSNITLINTIPLTPDGRIPPESYIELKPDGSQVLRVIAGDFYNLNMAAGDRLKGFR